MIMRGTACLCTLIPFLQRTHFPPIVFLQLAVLCCAQLLSCVQLFATPWTVALQAPLSMEFSRQEYWSGLPCPPPEDLPNQGINFLNPGLPHLPSQLPGKGILPGQILKLIRTRNSFLCLFHLLPSWNRNVCNYYLVYQAVRIGNRSSRVAVAKRQGREKPAKIEQRKVQGPE